MVKTREKNKRSKPNETNVKMKSEKNSNQIKKKVASLELQFRQEIAELEEVTRIRPQIVSTNLTPTHFDKIELLASGGNFQYY